MNCTAVRELLPERALSALGADEAKQVERHLAWCAGCRKEAEELQQGAAFYGMALPPVELPADLAERVVNGVRLAAGRSGGNGLRRRTRSAAAMVVAAMIGVSGLGWGAVMAGRAERFQDRADRAQARQEYSLRRFDWLIRQRALLAGREDASTLVRLAPASSGVLGGGTALLYVSPDILDFAIVRVAGLARDPAPYRVWLVSSTGAQLKVGRIAPNEIDADGTAAVAADFNADLTGFTNVEVRSADGVVVLSGSAGSL